MEMNWIVGGKGVRVNAAAARLDGELDAYDVSLDGMTIGRVALVGRGPLEAYWAASVARGDVDRGKAGRRDRTEGVRFPTREAAVAALVGN